MDVEIHALHAHARVVHFLVHTFPPATRVRAIAALAAAAVAAVALFIALHVAVRGEVRTALERARAEGRPLRRASRRGPAVEEGEQERASRRG